MTRLAGRHRPPDGYLAIDYLFDRNRSLCMAPTINFPWNRYWYRRGDRPTLVNDYLVPLGSKLDWFSKGQTATLRTLPELGGIPCLVLLGDPGTGKSNEIAAEAVWLGAAPTVDFKVKRLDLKLRTESLIEKQVFRSEEFIGWTEGCHALALFFDSMDECWRRVPELGPVIVAVLDGAATRGIPLARSRSPTPASAMTWSVLHLPRLEQLRGR